MNATHFTVCNCLKSFKLSELPMVCAILALFVDKMQGFFCTDFSLRLQLDTKIT